MKLTYRQLIAQLSNLPLGKLDCPVVLLQTDIAGSGEEWLNVNAMEPATDSDVHSHGNMEKGDPILLVF